MAAHNDSAASVGVPASSVPAETEVEGSAHMEALRESARHEALQYLIAMTSRDAEGEGLLLECKQRSNTVKVRTTSALCRCHAMRLCPAGPVGFIEFQNSDFAID